MEQFKT
jgi:pre-mRNA-processing factor 17